MYAPVTRSWDDTALNKPTRHCGRIQGSCNGQATVLVGSGCITQYHRQRASTALSGRAKIKLPASWFPARAFLACR